MASWGVAEKGWRKGPWTPEEDKLLVEYVSSYGEGRWSCVSKCAGLNRSGKSCRLRWVNYLRPGLKKGHITPQEEGIIIELHALWGNKWSTIARYLPGRTDNEIKNYWRTHFKKRKSSSSSDENSQEKRKIQCQKEATINNGTSNVEASRDEEAGGTREGKKETVISEGRSSDQLMLATTRQECNSTWCWSDFDNCLNIGGLGDMDDPNGCSKTAIHNQPNIAGYSRGDGGGGGGGRGDAMNCIRSGGYIF